MSKQTETYFVVTYKDPKDGQVLDLSAKTIHDSTLGLSFISIGDFLFDKTKLVVTPEEEALQKRLENVKTLHISIYSILSIKEVGGAHPGLQFKNDKSNLLVLPTPEKS